MAATAQEEPKVFELTKKINQAIYLAKTSLRHSYIMKNEFIRLHPNVHESVDHPSLVPMDLSVRAVATTDNVEEHLKELHKALRHCLGLLICYIEKDEHDHGKKTDLLGINRSLLKYQLETLVVVMKDLMTGDGPHLETTPYQHPQCTPESRAQLAGFDFLVFTYRLLDEMPTWMQLTLRNLMVFRAKKEEEELNAIKG